MLFSSPRIRSPKNSEPEFPIYYSKNACYAVIDYVNKCIYTSKSWLEKKCALVKMKWEDSKLAVYLGFLIVLKIVTQTKYLTKVYDAAFLKPYLAIKSSFHKTSIWWMLHGT